MIDTVILAVLLALSLSVFFSHALPDRVLHHCFFEITLIPLKNTQAQSCNHTHTHSIHAFTLTHDLCLHQYKHAPYPQTHIPHVPMCLVLQGSAWMWTSELRRQVTQWVLYQLLYIKPCITLQSVNKITNVRDTCRDSRHPHNSVINGETFTRKSTILLFSKITRMGLMGSLSPGLFTTKGMQEKGFLWFGCELWIVLL